MAETIKYKCSHCGKEHEEYPALTYTSPDNYAELSEEEKEKMAKLSNDFCVITYPAQTDRFIRATLTQKINDHCEDIDYGIWVSLSETSFNDYNNNFDNPNHVKEYFGYLCNTLNGYQSTMSIPTTVKTRTGGQRPEVIPHKDFDHPFVHDYYNGITKKEAERRIQYMLDVTGE
jgi:hypothetical protein